jgi:hypothetical protein
VKGDSVGRSAEGKRKVKVKRIKVHYIHIYEDSIMKPTTV